MKRLLLKALMLLAAAPMLSGQAVYEPEEIHKKAPAVPQFVVRMDPDDAVYVRPIPGLLDGGGERV